MYGEGGKKATTARRKRGAGGNGFRKEEAMKDSRTTRERG